MRPGGGGGMSNPPVSMESGLEDRNNPPRMCLPADIEGHVSMESGLEDRNNR